MTVAGYYFVIKKIRSDKKRSEEVKKLKEQVEKYKKLERLYRIGHLANGLSVESSWMWRCRGGNYIDVDYIDCAVKEGLRYLNNE